MRIDYNPPKDAAVKQTGGADDRQQAEMGGEGEEGAEGEEGDIAAEGEEGEQAGSTDGAVKKRRLDHFGHISVTIDNNNNNNSIIYSRQEYISKWIANVQAN